MSTNTKNNENNVKLLRIAESCFGEFFRSNPSCACDNEVCVTTINNLPGMFVMKNLCPHFVAWANNRSLLRRSGKEVVKCTVAKIYMEREEAHVSWFVEPVHHSGQWRLSPELFPNSRAMCPW